MQVVTGVFLAMHYSPDIEHAFASVEHITRDIYHGFTLRYLHANGASIFFLCVYPHIGRGIYYGSYLGGGANSLRGGGHYIFIYDCHRFYGLCFTMGANVILGGHGYN